MRSDFSSRAGYGFGSMNWQNAMVDWLLNHAPVIALCISVLALVTSAFTLGWNIYRDVVMKPKLLVDFGIKNMIDGSEVSKPPLLIISATNYGPGQTTCEMTMIKKSSLLRIPFRRVQRFVVMHDYTNPLCSKLPSRLNMAEKIDLVFPYDRDCFLDSTTNSRRSARLVRTSSLGTPKTGQRSARPISSYFPESNQR